MFVVPEPLCYTIASTPPVSHLPCAQLAATRALTQVLWFSLAAGFWAGQQHREQLEVRVTKPHSPRQHLPTGTTGSLTVCGVGNCRQCNGMGVHFQLHLCPGNAEDADGAIAVACHYVLALSSPCNDGMGLPGQALAALQSNQGRDPMTQRR